MPALELAHPDRRVIYRRGPARGPRRLHRCASPGCCTVPLCGEHRCARPEYCPLTAGECAERDYLMLDLIGRLQAWWGGGVA